MSFTTTITGNVKNQDLQTEDNRLIDCFIDNNNTFPDNEPLFWWSFWKERPGRYDDFFEKSS